MKNLLFARKFWFTALASLLFATNALASGISGTLVVENKSKGRHYSITVKPDGSFQTPELPPGSYTFKCDLTAPDGTTLPFAATIEYQVITAKEHGSGMATGRVNKIEAICVKQKVAGSHSSNATWSAIAIDEQGVHITGKIAMKDQSGKTMMTDSWTATK